MINNLDEAIKHCEDKTKELRETYFGWKVENVSCVECANEHEQLAGWLKELKQRREADMKRWIPVSERLPEDRRTVLVTAYWHETYQVMEAAYFGNEEWWCVPFNNCGDHMLLLKPKAWRPLPDPYKE